MSTQLTDAQSSMSDVSCKVRIYPDDATKESIRRIQHTTYTCLPAGRDAQSSMSDVSCKVRIYPDDATKESIRRIQHTT